MSTKFQSLCTLKDSEAPALPAREGGGEINVLVNTELNPKEVRRLLQELDWRGVHKPDGIPPFVPECAETLDKPLVMLFIKISGNECNIPTEWKRASVVPQKNSHERQIVSLRRMTCKLLEQTVRKHLEDF